MIRLDQTRIKWPEVRIDHIAACNRVVKELIEAPRGKPFSPSALARRTGQDWHTVDRCMERLFGRRTYWGVISRTTPNGPDLIYLDPVACEALKDAERKAAGEGLRDLELGIRDLRAKHCQYQ